MAHNHASAYNHFGKKKPSPGHFITGSAQKPNRMVKKPKKKKESK